jgi:aspartate racemase
VAFLLDKVELVLGVIGGLGPEATLDFFAKVLQHSKAASDQDHIHVIIDNNPKTPQ